MDNKELKRLVNRHLQGVCQNYAGKPLASGVQANIDIGIRKLLATNGVVRAFHTILKGRNLSVIFKDPFLRINVKL